MPWRDRLRRNEAPPERASLKMFFGSMMLIKTDVEFLQMSWPDILPVVALVSQMAGSLLTRSTYCGK